MIQLGNNIAKLCSKGETLCNPSQEVATRLLLKSRLPKDKLIKGVTASPAPIIITRNPFSAVV